VLVVLVAGLAIINAAGVYTQLVAGHVGERRSPATGGRKEYASVTLAPVASAYLFARILDWRVRGTFEKTFGSKSRESCLGPNVGSLSCCSRTKGAQRRTFSTNGVDDRSHPQRWRNRDGNFSVRLSSWEGDKSSWLRLNGREDNGRVEPRRRC
jgi:hypothetical protein